MDEPRQWGKLRDILISFELNLKETLMAQMIVRNIDEGVKNGLKARANLHGWSMEEEVRQILRQAVSEPAQARKKLGTRISARFAGLGLVEPLPELHGQAIEPMALGE